MSAATAEWVVFHFNPLFRLFKSLSDFLSVENVSIKVLTENLSSLILNCIFRIDWDDIVDAHFKKDFSNFFRVARIDKNNFRQELLKVF